MENENGVSEIAGAILLVALVILAMMIVAVALLSQPPPREIPQVNAVAGNNTSYIFIRHNGGDPLTPLETIVRIDGNPNPVPNDQILLRYENGTQANWTTQDWTVGTTLVIPDSRTPQSVSLIYNGGSSQALLLTATFTETPASVAPTLPPGSYHTITSTAGSGGHISPSGQVQVPDGGFQNFIVTPDPCYRISGVIVDGSPAGAVSSYSFNNVQADHTISAAFASNTLSIVATAGANGSILPNGTVPATCHGSQTFSITPSPGYYVQNVLVDGSAVGPVATYTFGDIVANHTISASFSTSPPYCVPVIANFNAVPTSGDVPLSVTFTDTSTGHPNSWQWDFGDGTVNSTVQNPIHTYAAGGSYTVTLTAFNTTCGNSGSVTFTNLINATSPAPACGTISGYKWNDLNGNGNWDSGEPGLSGWTINVSEKQGNHWTSLATTVTNSSGYYIFTGLTYHPANDYLVQETLQTGWQETFPASGSWEVHLEPPGPGSVGVPPKCYATDVNFGNKWAPDFSGSPRNGPAPLTVDFTDLSTGSSSWLWNFGDGGTSTNKNPTHTYPNPGTYTVTLTVSNSWQTVAIQKVGYIVINSCMSGYGNPILFNKNWNDNSVHGFLKDGTYVQVRNIYGTSNDHSYIRINGETIDLAYGDTVRLAIHGDQTTGDADIYTSQITRFNFYADLYINDLNTPYRTGSVDKIWIKVYDSYMSTLSFHMPSITSSTRFEANGNVLIDWYPLNGDIVDIVNIGVPPDGQARIDLKSTSVYIDCSGNYAACPV